MSQQRMDIFRADCQALKLWSFADNNDKLFLSIFDGHFSTEWSNTTPC